MYINGRMTNFLFLTVVLGASLWLVNYAMPPNHDEAATATSREDERPSDATGADVVSVEVSGNSGAYTFAAGIASPGTGCEQYADWWEVVTPEGELLYRRILLHPHENEQPFVRSGGPVAIETDTTVIVRAHMHPGGYGGAMMEGTVAGGFAQRPGDRAFAAALESVPPTPEGCGP